MASQCLFFLKSRLGQVATPFSKGTLERKLKLVQVTHSPEHIASVVEHPQLMELIDFLRYVDGYLKVAPEVLEFRQRAIKLVSESRPDVTCKIPTIPMSPNYFFRQLNELIEELIIKSNYQYVGLFDVGRCGISAIRNLTRTGPGFSGWYGRALMGDALLSSLSIALTSPHPVLAFVGDGAKALVPDVVPFFIESAINAQEHLIQNVTIFFFVNGSHSVINTYQEGFLAKYGGRQMRVPSIVQPDREEVHGNLRVCYRRLEIFDREFIRSSLLAPAPRLNLVSVFVSHNNEGDGLSLLVDKLRTVTSR